MQNKIEILRKKKKESLRGGGEEKLKAQRDKGKLSARAALQSRSSRPRSESAEQTVRTNAQSVV